MSVAFAFSFFQIKIQKSVCSHRYFLSLKRKRKMKKKNPTKYSTSYFGIDTWNCELRVLWCVSLLNLNNRFIMAIILLCAEKHCHSSAKPIATTFSNFGFFLFTFWTTFFLRLHSLSFFIFFTIQTHFSIHTHAFLPLSLRHVHGKHYWKPQWCALRTPLIFLV